MLPHGTKDFAPNLMWKGAVDALVDARQALTPGAGILSEDRLRRNLLSSQPLCFNLFGSLGKEDPGALLPWVRVFAPAAMSVSRVRLEYAPDTAELGDTPLGGSAFDAFVEYDLPDASKGFIGIETKYHEDLAKGLAVPAKLSRARAKYVRETALRPWRAGAALELLKHRKNLQFWYNQLLAQRTHELIREADGSRRYAEYTQVVVACRQDRSAQEVVQTVGAQLSDGHQGRLRFCAIDDVIGLVRAHQSWKRAMRERYADFSPIQEHLSARSPLRVT